MPSPPRRTPVDLRKAAAHVVTAMREGRSFTAAAREVGVSRATVERYAGPALRRVRGRVVPTTGDRLPRTLLFVVADGAPIYVTVRGSRAVSRLAEYLNVLKQWLTASPFANAYDEAVEALLRFRGVRIAGRELVTDLTTLRNLAAARLLSGLDNFYA